MSVILKKPLSLTDKKFHYCPGCTHGVIHRLIAEIIDEYDIREQTIGIAPVGCSVFLDWYFNFDIIQAAHGRAPAVATGVKRVLTDNVVFTYHGDGDLASIGIAELIHAAARGENITIVFINNACYGMTGGQMAPTTLEKQITTTTPYGRDHKTSGSPFFVPELLTNMHGVGFLSRRAINNPKNIVRTKKSLKTAFKVQMEGLGFSLVEILSICPVNWGMDPQKSMQWLEDNIIPHYPLGDIKMPDFDV